MRFHGRSAMLSFAAAGTLQMSLPVWSWSPAVYTSPSTCNLAWRRRRENLATAHATMATEGGEAATFSAKEAQDLRYDDHHGEVVAEGVVVAQFGGGDVTAVRVLDDMQSSNSNNIQSVQGADVTSSGKQSSATGDDLQGRNVIFADQSRGVVVAHRPPVVFVYSTTKGDDSQNMDGPVKILNTRLEISVPREDEGEDAVHLKQVVGNDVSQDRRTVFSPIPQVKDIALINHPMLTGITMFDALAPIGRGQNMLFVGHDLPDMRRYAVDFLSNQLRSNPGVKCVYAAIDDADEVIGLLENQNIRQSVQLVAPSTAADDEMAHAAEAVATAATSCAMAESLALENGDHTIVVVDTIDWHKKFWDGTTRVLVDVFGVDAVVRGDREGGASSEMRAFFSTLVQRAAQYNMRRGGGSVTLLMLTQIPRMEGQGDATFEESDFEGSSEKVKERIKLLMKNNIPLTVQTLRKIDIPIPSASEGKRRLVLQHVDDLISMTDGQIWLDEKLENFQRSPPMDPQRSITRVGIGADTESRADAPALRRIVEGLRLLLSQADNMEGAEANLASKRQTQRQNAFLVAMHQASGTGGRRLSESCAALLAASKGSLDRVAETGKTEDAIEGLLQHLQSSIPDIMHEIDDTLDLSEANKDKMSNAIESYMSI